MSDSFRFIAYFQFPEPKLSSLPVLLDLVMKLSEQGYTIVDGYAWPFDKPVNLVADTNAVVNRITAYYNANSDIIHETFWRYPFEFGIALDIKNLEHWMLEVEQDTLMGPSNELGEQNALELLDMIREVLKTYRPYFGCGLSGLMDSPPLGLASNLRVNAVYPINFYGKAYLDRNHLDIQRVLAVPNIFVEEIEDGVLLVPSIRSIYTDDKILLTAVAHQLGLS